MLSVPLVNMVLIECFINNNRAELIYIRLNNTLGLYNTAVFLLYFFIDLNAALKEVQHPRLFSAKH